MTKQKQTNPRYRAAVSQFVISRTHPHAEAQKWLSRFLQRLDWSKVEDPSLWGFEFKEQEALTPEFQIALLIACLERMIWLRAHRVEGARFDRVNYDIGGVVYSIANDLFRRDLPFSEGDVCEILETARHECGHGGDVAPPFDLALAHARKHRVSKRLLASLGLYVRGLSGLKSKRVQDVKRRADLLFTLDHATGRRNCWSARFRDGLRKLSPRQQAAWRAVIVQMDAKEFRPQS